jgi:DNA-binding beta-propeller fold protein YncE
VLRALLVSALALATPLPGATSFAVCRTTSIPYPPHALTAAGGSLWVGCGTRIERRSPSGKLLAVVKTPGLHVWGLAAAGGYVWAVDRDTPTLLRIAPKTSKLTRFPLPEPPIELAAAGGALWAAFDASGTAARIDPRTAKAGRTVRVGDGPSSFASDGTHVWAIAHRDGSLVRVDTRTRLAPQQATNTVTPERIAFAGGSLWVTGRGKQLDRVDLDGHVTGTTEIGAAGVDVTAVASRVYVFAATAEGARRGDPLVASVAVIDPATGTVTRHDATGPFSVLGYAPLGGRLAILDGLNGRVVIL